MQHTSSLRFVMFAMVASWSLAAGEVHAQTRVAHPNGHISTRGKAATGVRKGTKGTKGAKGASAKSTKLQLRTATTFHLEANTWVDVPTVLAQASREHAAPATALQLFELLHSLNMPFDFAQIRGRWLQLTPEARIHSLGQWGTAEVPPLSLSLASVRFPGRGTREITLSDEGNTVFGDRAVALLQAASYGDTDGSGGNADKKVHGEGFNTFLRLRPDLK